METTRHHSIFSNFTPWSGICDLKRFWVNFLGVKTRVSFFLYGENKRKDNPINGESFIKTDYPVFNEEYFEWIDLLEAVLAAKDKFLMIELGAGYGRWLVNAAYAIKRLGNNIPYKLIGIEAEPQHFKFMIQHFQDNGVGLTEHKLTKAAINDRDGTVLFCVGAANIWYGQSIYQTPKYSVWDRIKEFVKIHFLTLETKDVDFLSGKEFIYKYHIKKIKSLSLTTLLRDLDFIDLIDLDIQGSEFIVLNAAKELLQQKVKRIHIETHTYEIEENLRRLFSNLGWYCIHDFPQHSEVEIRYGKIKFQGGIQSWLNPQLGRKSSLCQMRDRLGQTELS